MNDSSTSNNPVRTLVLVVVGVLAVLVAGGTAFALDLKQHQWKLWDEWECSQGEVPILGRHGGSACIAEGARVPKGYRLDPLGNRPFDCTDRDGWVLIEPMRSAALDGATCYPSGKALPKGWRIAAS